jgi:hypothetical protein
MIIAEQLVLLALDPERGTFARGIDGRAVSRGACACLLAELVLSRRVARRGRGIARLDNLPVFNPLLDAAGKALPAAEVSVPDALARIAGVAGSINRRLLDGLVSRDVLHRSRALLVFSRHPVRSMQALREVFDRLYEVVRAEEPSSAALALAVVADRCGVLEARTTPDELTRIRERITTLRRNPDIASVDFSLLLEVGDAVAAA